MKLCIELLKKSKRDNFDGHSNNLSDQPCNEKHFSIRSVGCLISNFTKILQLFEIMHRHPNYQSSLEAVGRQTGRDKIGTEDSVFEIYSIRKHVIANYSCYPVIADPIIANFIGQALSNGVLLRDFQEKSFISCFDFQFRNVGKNFLKVGMSSKNLVLPRI